MGEEPNGAVPVFRFGPDTLAHHDLFDLWHETARPLFDTQVVGDLGSFRGGITAAKIGDLVLTNVHFTPQKFTRNRRHLSESNHFQIQLYTRGGVTGVRGDSPYRLVPGQIGLCDWSLEHHAVATRPAAVLGISIPWERLDRTRLNGQATLALAANSGAGLLLAGALQALYRHLETWSALETGQAANGLVGLVNGLLSEHHRVDDATAVRRLCLVTIKRYVDRHLHRPELDAAHLMSVFGCSRSGLYRLFQDDGGVDRYLREKRLARCFRELAGASRVAGRIKKIAERWGFYDPSHFNRLFKQSFSLRPSDALASNGVRSCGYRSLDRAPDQAVETVHGWLRSL